MHENYRRCGFQSLIVRRYFGRAKDLPGVRELFEGRKKEAEEESQALTHYKKFMHQGPSYFGDLAEQDGELLKYERELEEEGTGPIGLSLALTSRRLGRSIC